MRQALDQDPTRGTRSCDSGRPCLGLGVFYPPYDRPTPLQLRLGMSGLERYAPGIGESWPGAGSLSAMRAGPIRLPSEAQSLWGFVGALSGQDFLGLLAHCASLGLNAVRNPHERRASALAQAEVMATALALDMTTLWTPSAEQYLGRVSKARILEAVEEGASPSDAERIVGLRKTDMVELLDDKGLLPSLLRTTPSTEPEPDTGCSEAVQTCPLIIKTDPEDEAYPFAAE